MAKTPTGAETARPLQIDPERPLIISDADEVLLQFAATLEHFFGEHNLVLRFDSYGLIGNVRDRETGDPADGATLAQLLNEFFTHRVGDCPPVEGAVEALERLSRDAQIVILSNVPKAAAPAREASLRAAGLDYPLLANEGVKGPAVKALREDHRARSVFLDDIPANLSSVAQHDADTHLIHFIADSRLRSLLPRAPEAHARIDEWAEAEDYIRAYLAGAD